MKTLIIFFLLIPFVSISHPGIAIVKDSKGNIYYSDLKQIWRISKGYKEIVVPNVHSHELFIDKDDNLYGEHVFNEEGVAEKFFHYLWVLRPTGVLDTVISTRQAYLNIDFSLARDRDGHEYYIKQFINTPDTNSIYKKLANGKEIVFATGNFKGVTWLHPQKDGSILFVRNNTVFRITKEGATIILANNIANENPSFKFSGKNKTVWGVWQDDSNNAYVAVFSDQTVRKINTKGVVSDYYKSKGNWAPTHGVFDDKGNLWLLESSDQNEIRVIEANTSVLINQQKKWTLFPLLLIVVGIGVTIWVYLYNKAKKLSRIGYNHQT